MGAEYGIQTNTKDKYKNSDRHAQTQITNMYKDRRTDTVSPTYYSPVFHLRLGTMG